MSQEQSYPKVSFIMPVLNAAVILENCLQSIARQTYPRDRYEIVIADGGSKDGSQEVAKKFGASVIDDQASRHMEDAKRVALSQATGEYVVFVDADNELSHSDYLELAIKALAANPQALGVEAYYPASPKMTSFNAYLTHLLHISDPLAWLMSVNPVLVARDGEVERWTLPPDTLSYPLGANGFVYRRADVESVRTGDKMQDTHVAMKLMQAGKREWLRIRDRGVHHYYTDTLLHFIHKRRRAVVHYFNIREEFGGLWLQNKPPMPAWLASLYCVSVVVPTFHALGKWMKSGDARWMWHPFACVASVVGTGWGWYTHRQRKGERKLVADLQPRQTLGKDQLNKP